MILKLSKLIGSSLEKCKNGMIAAPKKFGHKFTLVDKFPIRVSPLMQREGCGDKTSWAKNTIFQFCENSKANARAENPPKP